MPLQGMPLGELPILCIHKHVMPSWLSVAACFQSASQTSSGAARCTTVAHQIMRDQGNPPAKRMYRRKNQYALRRFAKDMSRDVQILRNDLSRICMGPDSHLAPQQAAGRAPRKARMLG